MVDEHDPIGVRLGYRPDIVGSREFVSKVIESAGDWANAYALIVQLVQQTAIHGPTPSLRYENRADGTFADRAERILNPYVMTPASLGVFCHAYASAGRPSMANGISPRKTSAQAFR